jgi:hypothetical protein
MKLSLLPLATLFLVACGGPAFEDPGSTFQAPSDAPATTDVVDSGLLSTPRVPLRDASPLRDSDAAPTHDASPVDAPAEAEAAPPPPTYCCIVQEYSSGNCQPYNVEMPGNWTCGDTTQSETTCGIGNRCWGVVDDCYGDVQYCQP